MLSAGSQSTITSALSSCLILPGQFVRLLQELLQQEQVDALPGGCILQEMRLEALPNCEVQECDAELLMELCWEYVGEDLKKMVT